MQRLGAVKPQTAPQAKPSCGFCKFGREVDGYAHIECVRFPPMLHKHANDWCGEFAQKDSK